MTASERLRALTASAHDRVDTVYGGFDLGERGAYAAFLVAHARALPAVESALVRFAALPAFRPRTALLAADLAALGVSMPVAATFAPASAAAGWGALYVIEGSRLGGGMLAKRVGAGLPTAYLGAKHLPGEWRDFRAALDQAAIDDAWMEAAVAGAASCFDLYAGAIDAPSGNGPF